MFSGNGVYLWKAIYDHVLHSCKKKRMHCIKTAIVFDVVGNLKIIRAKANELLLEFC